MSFGLTFEKILVIGLIALFVVGPERLPLFSSRLARMIREAREIFGGARSQFREEFGPELDQFKRATLDPLEGDPKRSVGAHRRDVKTEVRGQQDANEAPSEQRNRFASRSSVPFDPDVS